MLKEIKGTYIWIIGASSGIGAALAKELAERGATVALSARRETELIEIGKTLKGEGHKILPLDVVQQDQIDDHIKDLSETWPRIDSVVFLAAVYDAHTKARKDLKNIHSALSVNIGGAYNIAEKMMDYFIRNKHAGQIVLCGSVAGYRGLPQGQPYCSTKAAIISYAESLKVEAEQDNIDVKLICPGFVETPLTSKNKFKMPFIIPAEKAAKHIADGMAKKSFEIHFPKVFTFMLKFMRLLPYGLYFKISRAMVKKI